MATFFYIIEILAWSIQIFTGLLLGFSMVGLTVRPLIHRFMWLSLAFGTAFSIAHQFYPSPILLPAVVAGIFIALVFILKAPATQVLIAVLLAILYNLLIITLLEYNVFYLLLDIGDVSLDAGTELSIDLFVMLNNIFLSILIVTKSPVLFPKGLFEKSLHAEDPEISFSGQVYSVILILFLLVVGLYYTSLELSHIRPNYRWFLTLWTLAVTVAIILFQRKLILFKNERVQVFLDKQYQKELLSFFSMIRSQRHDFNFHLSAINGMIQKKEYAACQTYIEEIVKSATAINDLLPLHHPATAAMLSTFKEQAAAKGIAIEFIIMNDLRKCPCSVYEINKVIGNLIQNAIDEVAQLPNRDQPIYVELNAEKDQLSLVVTNEIRLKGDRLADLFQVGYSTKEQHEGLGLPAVKKIVEKYHGVIYPELDAGFISFHVSIPEGSTT